MPKSGARPVTASSRATPPPASAGTGCIRSKRRRPATSRRCLSGSAPVIAASDYARAWPQLIAPHVKAPFVVLGADGFGRSDTRAALRRFFEVDRHHVALAALHALAREGRIGRRGLRAAIARYGIQTESAPPWEQ